FRALARRSSKSCITPWNSERASFTSLVFSVAFNDVCPMISRSSFGTSLRAHKIPDYGCRTIPFGSAIFIALSYHGFVPTEVEKASKTSVFGVSGGFGAPYGIRTRVLALRGPRPRPLDEGSRDRKRVDSRRARRAQPRSRTRPPSPDRRPRRGQSLWIRALPAGAPWAMDRPIGLRGPPKRERPLPLIGSRRGAGA